MQAMTEGPAMGKTSTTVMVIDDEPYILRSPQYLFTREGYTVATATNGVDGLDVVPPVTAACVLSTKLP